MRLYFILLVILTSLSAKALTRDAEFIPAPSNPNVKIITKDTKLKGYKYVHKYEYGFGKILKLMDQMSGSKLKEVKKLRKTLMKWREEILNYFKTKLTNAKTKALTTWQSFTRSGRSDIRTLKTIG